MFEVASEKMPARMKLPDEELLVVEEIPFKGHPLVKATHPRTIEITTEGHLTLQGDCIVGVGAAKGVGRLLPSTKRALRSDDARVRLTVVTPGGKYSFTAMGSKDLPLESPAEMVIRTSEFVCGRTLAIRADASAREIPRELVRSLKSPSAAGMLRIEVLA